MPLGLRSPFVRNGYGSSTFTPASLFAGGFSGMWLDISDTSKMWQDTAKTVPITGDNQPVRVVSCQLGSGDWVAPSDALRPIYRTSSGLHWLEFLTAAKVLRNTSFPALSGAGAFTKTLAFEWSSTAGNRVTDAYPGATHTIQVNTFHRSSSAASVAGGVSAHTFSTNTPYTYIQVFDGSLTATHADRNKCYRDASLIVWNSNFGTINSVTTTSSTSIIGAADATGTAPFQGKQFQWVMVNKALSDTERSNLDLFFRVKQGR